MGAPDNGPKLRTKIDAVPTAMEVSAMSLVLRFVSFGAHAMVVSIIEGRG